MDREALENMYSERIDELEALIEEKDSNVGKLNER
jgi:hypothetical protein